MLFTLYSTACGHRFDASVNEEAFSSHNIKNGIGPIEHKQGTCQYTVGADFLT